METGQPTGAPMPSGTAPYSVPAYSSGSLVDILKQPATILRILEWFFAVISFSTIASYGKAATGTSEGGFMIFTGVVAWLLTMVFLAVYILRPPQLSGRVWAYFEVAVSAIWVVFWFSASIAVAAYGCSFDCANFNASITFGFFSFAAWAASTWFAYMELRNL
ncbi:uncharacterized protein SPPG_07333 [Spizellomyces punctatus DAOM BR117]|uniref:MARVEL domain-containing protein n=1 Tax=Spizellomyces punctatus (strain DAOM BR117) TaxID=645134 RepID=A0A0L0H8Z2_SPIPD|nr:uncharacterized protein SPPG_07333 [Spizellomyces punctatus DAOM BR117]KNC97409.1 hypothetical protein SPPG_07333 [Spizellomyces punctatus DAOM BR117]|eukprot:XP_016605449.1 hypothetical protein SPPG_07333 [Spizellomyces punctatus DAOM BR117]